MKSNIFLSLILAQAALAARVKSTATNIIVTTQSSAVAKAFPEAEGYGSETKGGRGGKVYIVDTLNWRGPGSLGDALLAKGPRIIVFRVSGVINVTEGVELDESNSYVTVAGQTSPGGITLTGAPGAFISSYQKNLHDVIFRFIRFRGRGNYDNIQLNQVHHIVIDHCDFSGGTDEAFDITHGSDYTVQWSTITNSDPAGQNYGALMAYPPNSRISWHHNFLAHHKNRCLAHMHWGNPGAPEDKTMIDMRNNLVYNCAFDAIMYNNDPGANAGHISFNLVNNYFKAGLDTPSSAYDFALNTNAIKTFESGTIYEGGARRSISNQSAATTMVPVTTYTSTQAYDIVLQKVGAFPRDAMNARVVNEMKTKTGRLGKLDDALLTSAVAAPTDTDRDGMPDAWEAARGLNPSNVSDAVLDRNNDGYTNIEEYINELAASLIP